MTSPTATATQETMRNLVRSTEKNSNEAPMVITRLSGWIDVGDGKLAGPGWIVPTRTHARAR